MTSSAYREAGVDIDAGNRAVELMKDAVRSTFTPSVLADVGSFGGLFALDKPAGAARAGQLDRRRGHQGQAGGASWAAGRGSARTWSTTASTTSWCRTRARSSSWTMSPPASSTRRQWPSVVTGMAAACRAARCALIGGETAEMPGVYAEGAFDVAGAVVGLVDRAALLPRQDEMAGRRHARRPAQQRAAHQRLLADPPRRRRARHAPGARRWADAGRCAAGPAPLLSCRGGGDPGGRITPSRAWPTSPAAASSRMCRACCRPTWPRAS